MRTVLVAVVINVTSFMLWVMVALAQDTSWAS